MGENTGTYPENSGPTREVHARGSPFHAHERTSVTKPQASPALLPSRAENTSGRGRAFAFTIIELLIVLTGVAILLAVLIPAVVKARAKSQLINCVCHLKNVGLAFRIFATDNGDKFPWELATNAPPLAKFDEALKYYLAVSNGISTPKIFVCPADARKAAPSWAVFSRTNLSYFYQPFIRRNVSAVFPRG